MPTENKRDKEIKGIAEYHDALALEALDLPS